MSKYVDADEVVKTLTNNQTYSATVLQAIIDRIPKADVEPVRHGHWILEKTPDGKPYCFHCSVCDDDFKYIGIKTGYDYCPLCGAKMNMTVQH